MRILMSAAAAIALMACTMGCATCQSPYDETYPAYGGSQPRTDMSYGRVGSRFGPTGVTDQAAPAPGGALPVDDEGTLDVSLPAS